MEKLQPDVRAALEATIAGDGIVLYRSGVPIGSLEFRSNVLEGSVVERSPEPVAAASAPGRVTVIATAMRLSAVARRRLSDGLGADYIVLDIHEAPSSAEVLLTHPSARSCWGSFASSSPTHGS